MGRGRDDWSAGVQRQPSSCERNTEAGEVWWAWATCLQRRLGSLGDSRVVVA